LTLNTDFAEQLTRTAVAIRVQL